MADLSKQIQSQLQTAIDNKQAIKIIAGNSLSLFSQHNTSGETVNVAGHSGVIHYAPEELVIQVRAGTTIKEINAVLDQRGQKLPFEPPILSDTTTIGGIVACGLTGSSMPFYGSVKDCLLGVRMINGYAENLVFGGVVIKNVAGFDLTRLQVGAYGQYGVLLDFAIKVIPKTQDTQYMNISCDESDALNKMNILRQQATPLSAMAYYDNQLMLRLSGYSQSNQQFIKNINMDVNSVDSTFWDSLNTYKHPIFNIDETQTLYRISTSVSSKALKLNNDDEQLIDWAGGLRWVKTTNKLSHIENKKSFIPYAVPSISADKVMQQYQQKLKSAFDPNNLINAN